MDIQIKIYYTGSEYVRRRRSEDFLMATFAGSSLLLMYRLIIVSALITVLGVSVFINQKRYSWLILYWIFLVAAWVNKWTGPGLPPSLYVFMFLLAIQLEEWYYLYRVKKALTKIVVDTGDKPVFIEVLPYKVRKYAQNHYNLQRPVMIEILKGKEVIRAYFDLKSSELFIEEPVLFPVYMGFPEKVWKEVISAYGTGTQKETEFRDKFGNLVGVITYDESGSKTQKSWRLKRSLYETWDPVHGKWVQRPRGWRPR